MATVRIPLDQAKPGMILAQQMVRADGVLLASKGAEITEPLLRILDRLGHETVPVEMGAVESPDDRLNRIKLEEQEIEIRFSRVQSDPILAELKKAVLAKLHGEE